MWLVLLEASKSRVVVELAADVTMEEACRIGNTGRRKLPARVLRRAAVVVLIMAAAAAGAVDDDSDSDDVEGFIISCCSSRSSSSATQRSQTSQPRNVPTEVQLTAETGEMRS